jgi:Major intrinsic protein
MLFVSLHGYAYVHMSLCVFLIVLYYSPEAHLEFHRNWVPLQVSSKNTLLRWWIEYMHNPLIQETVTIPRAIAEMPDEQLIWRMTVNFMRKLFAEFIGTFVMTFWAGAIRVLAVTGNTDLTGVTLQIAGMAIGIIYAIAHVSGAHLNTAVTWMFMIRGIFPIKWAILYWCIQLIGAILAGAFVLAMFGSESG